MKHIIAVLLALLLIASLAACHPDLPDTPAVTDPTATDPPTSENTEQTDPPATDVPYLPIDPAPGFSALEKLETSYRWEAAILKGSPIGGDVTLYVLDIGLTYYVVHQPADAETTDYYRGTLDLLDGYTNGRIVSVGPGAGSGEIVMTVVAEKDGSPAALDYLCLTDSMGLFVVTPRENIPDVPLARLIQVVENPGNLSVHTVKIPVKNTNTRVGDFHFNDRYRIYVTSEVLRNDASGYLVHTDDLFIVDLSIGEIVHREKLDIDEEPRELIYTDDGCVLLMRMPKENGAYYETSACYKITEADGTFTVTPVEWEAFPSTESIHRSPNGTYAVYQTMEDGWGNGGIDVKYRDGSVRRILTNVMLGDSPDCKAKDIGDVVGYTPLGFMDDTHFAYYIGGWEWVLGYGIYDLETGMTTEYRDGYRALTVSNGVLFIQAKTDYDDRYPVLPGDIYKVHADGKREKMPLSGLSSAGAKWLRYELETVGDTKRLEKSTVTVLSADMATELAKMEMVRPLHKGNTDYYLYENSITFVQKAVE